MAATAAVVEAAVVEEAIVPAFSHQDLAGHIAGILRQLGRPASPEELGTLCTRFPASPEVVVALCAVPGSPLLLSSGRMVCVRDWAVTRVGRFESLGVPARACLVNPTLPARLWEDRLLTYARKRKRSGGAVIPIDSRKRPVLCLEGWKACTVDGSTADNTGNVTVEIGFESSHDKTRDMSLLSSEVFDMDYAAKIYSQESRLLPKSADLLHSSSVAPCTIEFAESVQATKLEGNDGVAGLVQLELFDSKSKNEINLTEMTTCQRSESCEPSLQLALSLPLNETSNWREEIPFDGHFCTSFGREIENGLCLLNINCLEAGGDCCKTFAPGGTADPINCFNPEMDFLGSTFGKDIEGNKSLAAISFVGGLFDSDLVLSIATQAQNAGEAIILPHPDEKLDNINTLQISVLPSVVQSLSETPIDRCFPKTLGMDGQNSDDQNHFKDQPVDISKLQVSPSKSLCSVPVKQKAKRSRSPNIFNRQKNGRVCSKAVKNMEVKSLPTFEDFIAAEEEGSGGYGTVYKALRKNDGKIFAIKCPHANAPNQHISNELRMLERFGGKNFIIKYEGSFKSGNSDCFVLEHVEHDRPEVLKKEIGVSEILWYGYCLFKALASLHKLGVVHRDVKPGNFLFSRKLNKGYLIDFNLALDLRQKYCLTRKLKPNISNFTGTGHAPSSLAGSHAEKVKNDLHGKSMEAAKSSKPEKSSKRKGDVSYLKTKDKMQQKNACKSQGEASGVTTAKTPSADKYREPVPCKGRKELINFAQESIQSPYRQEVATGFQRKRVAAPLGKGENAMLYLSPMPLHSRGISISGAGVSSNKGEAKRRREGPCVGTKGFRAPEVLFKSPHQDPKLDIWSAGVTLLYLIIGRVPFVGEPAQNIKEIAKLRGSEELWEVAKLHNRECSFPEDLFDIRWLPSMDIRSWCEMNTKRPEFLEQIPMSLFYLVDRCLTINPRMRINAEDAVRHEFFSPCREILRKERLLKQSKLDAGSQLPLSDDLSLEKRQTYTSK